MILEHRDTFMSRNAPLMVLVALATFASSSW